MNLLIDLDTVLSAPRFFSLLALVLRASGFFVVVINGDPKRVNGEKAAADAGIPLQRYEQWDGLADVQIYKRAVALDLAKSGKTIWVDEELGRWKAPDVTRVEGLVVVNWRAVVGGGSTPAGLA